MHSSAGDVLALERILARRMARGRLRTKTTKSLRQKCLRSLARLKPAGDTRQRGGCAARAAWCSFLRRRMIPMDRKSPVDTHIGQRLKEYRQHRGMTVRELADAAHITPGQISRYEHGRDQELAADVCGLALDYLSKMKIAVMGAATGP